MGGEDGFTEAYHGFIHQSYREVQDDAETGDHFGFALASGHFNDDEFADLAIGAPDEDLDQTTNAGAVNVLFGWSSAGIVTAGGQIWHQDVFDTEDNAENHDRFGAALASGDFNADILDDLAVGIPGEDIEGKNSAGAAQVFYSDEYGPSEDGDQFWHMGQAGILGDPADDAYFGFALAGMDLNGDGCDELATGVPGQKTETNIQAGAVSLIMCKYEALSNQYNRLIDQSHVTTIGSDPEAGDWFGSALAAFHSPPVSQTEWLLHLSIVSHQ